MRPKGRQGKQLGHYVAPELVEKLKILSKQLDLPQSHLVEEALKLFFDKHAAALNPKAGKTRK